MHPAARGHNKGPKSTPVLNANRLYTLGVTGVLSCFNARDGRLIWRKEFSREFKTTSPLFGTAMSPVVESGLLIAHVGGHNHGALIAFDAATGAVKWSWNGDGPGYASPIVVDFNGTRQIVTQTQQHIVGVAASTGELLWKIPFTTEYVQNIVTPVYYDGMLIFSGLDKGTMAVKAVKRGHAWATEQVWRNPEVSSYMNTPVVSGGRLFGLSHKKKGQFFGLDLRTGKTLWTTEGREGENAAIISAGAVLFVLTDGAQLVVAKPSSAGLEVVRRYTVADSATWAHPAILPGIIIIKDVANLSLFRLA
jgi:outer membrane protein assembly factor BamB